MDLFVLFYLCAILCSYMEDNFSFRGHTSSELICFNMIVNRLCVLFCFLYASLGIYSICLIVPLFMVIRYQK
jgi:hypothetical protein